MTLKRKGDFGGFTVLALLLTFALCCFFVLSFAVRAYKSASDASGKSLRLSLAYIAGKLRHYDAKDGVHIGVFNGQSALYLYETHEDTRYETVLYSYENGLYELFAEDASSFTPTSGALVAEGISAHFFESDGLITVTCEDQGGHTRSLSLLPRSAGGGL